MKAKFIIGGICVVLLATTSFAQAQTARALKSERHDARRIKQGVKSGELTRSESLRLAKGEHRTNKITRHAKKDGKITRHEKKAIVRSEVRNDKAIFRKKHNKRDR